MWVPKEKPVWLGMKYLKDLKNFQIVRNIDDELSITIHNRESDNKIMVSLLGKKDENRLLWTMNECQFIDLCQFLASEINDKTDYDGKEIVMQVTMKIYEICGLNINTKYTDKIDDIIYSYKDKSHFIDKECKEWKVFVNFLSVFFYSRDEYITKYGTKSKYGRSVGLIGIIAVLKYDMPPEKACKIFENESGCSIGNIPGSEMERILEKYSVPQSTCINYDNRQKTIEESWGI